MILLQSFISMITIASQCFSSGIGPSYPLIHGRRWWWGFMLNNYLTVNEIYGWWLWKVWIDWWYMSNASSLEYLICIVWGYIWLFFSKIICESGQILWKISWSQKIIKMSTILDKKAKVLWEYLWLFSRKNMPKGTDFSKKFRNLKKLWKCKMYKAHLCSSLNHLNVLI